MKPNKIHIIGSVGSGKSTLARNLSKTLNLPYYELDNVVWRRTENGDVRNNPEARDNALQKIVQSDAWIIEGVHFGWVDIGFECADMIIFLDTPIFKRNYRILKRYIVQRLGFEKGNYKQSLKMLKKMYYWNYRFENKEKPEILKWLERYNNKLIILNDNTDYAEAIQ